MLKSSLPARGLKTVNCPPKLATVPVKSLILPELILPAEGPVKAKRAKGMRPSVKPTDRVTRSGDRSNTENNVSVGCSSWE